MADGESGGRYREEGWFILGSISTGFFVWMGLWDTLGASNAALLGFAAVFFTYTIASAPRSIYTGSDDQ